MGELAIQSEARAPLRDAFNGWFVTHEVAWELTMAALAVVYVALSYQLQPLVLPQFRHL
jgi:hypothetical protein